MPISDTTQVALETAMRGASMRQSLLTDNIANANTPGYQRTDLNFHGALQAALEAGNSPASAALQPEALPGGENPEGNGVNIDRESAQLAENGLEYQAVVQVMGARNEILRSAIGVV